MNTLVIVGIQFYVLLLNLFRICKQAELWSFLLNSGACRDVNYENHFNGEMRERLKNTGVQQSGATAPVELLQVSRTLTLPLSQR